MAAILHPLVHASPSCNAVFVVRPAALPRGLPLLHSTGSRDLRTGGEWGHSRVRGCSARSLRTNALFCVAAATLAESTAADVERLKFEVMCLLAPLDRGLAASADEVQRVDEAVRRLEVGPAGTMAIDFSVGGDAAAAAAAGAAEAPPGSFTLETAAVGVAGPSSRGSGGGTAENGSTAVLQASANSTNGGSSSSSGVSSGGSASSPSLRGLSSVVGEWRLVYSSAFASGSLGGLRPGPPSGRLPLQLGKVLQRIDLHKRQLDNVVDLRLGVLPWPLPPVVVTASLEHSFETFGPNGFRIFFDRTVVSPQQPARRSSSPSSSPPPLPFSLPSLSLPLQLPEFLRPPPALRSSTFATTFVDGGMRVTRGDRGELRVFVRQEE